MFVLLRDVDELSLLGFPIQILLVVSIVFQVVLSEYPLVSDLLIPQASVLLLLKHLVVPVANDYYLQNRQQQVYQL